MKKYKKLKAELQKLRQENSDLKLELERERLPTAEHLKAILTINRAAALLEHE
jgi:hypothetical protein